MLYHFYWIYALEFFFFTFFCVFRPAPVPCGSFRARDRIAAAAVGLCHSHGNARSKPHLWPMQQLSAMPDPEWDQGSNPYPHRHYVGFLTHWATTGTPTFFFFFLKYSCFIMCANFCWILNTLDKARNRAHILMDTSWVYYHWDTMGTP